ncbi:hypothetical protein RJ641_003682 [Dillenia turbinata]|uniref:DUF7794 domain-containing protein n=1 Tax=Dillenia turbinata TaxID=194707 RepID=A0AAN8V725_9MAGN
MLNYFLCVKGSADTVFFIDSPTHHFLRTPSSDSNVQGNPMSLLEVGATVSVLLGFAPPATLSVAGSKKLNEVLLPNPFDRPRAVFMLEVGGAEDSQLFVDHNGSPFESALQSQVLPGSDKADIQLPNEDGVSVFSFDVLGSETTITDKDLEIFASWVGGSYVANELEPLTGALTLSSGNGADLSFHISKKEDREIIARSVSLFYNFQGALDVHEGLSGTIRNPAELIKGSFDGLKAFGGVSQQRIKLFYITLSKILDSLQTAYEGNIVGVVIFKGTPLQESQPLMNVMFTSRPAVRWLEETTGSAESVEQEQKTLVRRTLAWITGLILLISTLLGVYFLLNMPLTRDTLLYSNVKLD